MDASTNVSGPGGAEPVKKGAPGHGVLLFLVVLSLGPWLFASFLSFFAFDAPGSEKNVGLWWFVVPLWCYPLVALPAMALAWFLKRGGHPGAGRFALMAPLAYATIYTLAVVGVLGADLVGAIQAERRSPNVRYARVGLDEFPAEVFEHPVPIDSLDLSGNRLTALPPSIGKLKSLRYLNLSGNQLTTLPPEIGELTHLVMLKLSDNQLRSLPDEFADLAALRELDLSGNLFSALPPQVRGLPLIENVRIAGNPIQSLPPEVADWLALRPGK